MPALAVATLLWFVLARGVRGKRLVAGIRIEPNGGGSVDRGGAVRR